MKTSGWYAVMLSIGLLVGFSVGGSSQGHNANAQGAFNSAAARFQLSAFGAVNQSGCYIVDTQTGSLWMTTGIGQPRKLSDKLP